MLKGTHILNKRIPKINYRDKIVSLDTHGESETGDVYSVYNTPRATESNHSSGNPEHYAKLICGASLIPPSGSPMLDAPHMPLLIPRSWILGPSSDVGLRRACNAALSQSPLSPVSGPGELGPHIEEGVVTRGESSWEDLRDSREGQAEGGDHDPNPLGGSSDPSVNLGPSLPPPPNDRKVETSC